MKQDKPVPFVIKSLSNQLKRLLDKQTLRGESSNLTGVQFMVMGYITHETLAAGRDVYQRDIEAEFDIRRSTATGVLQLMEKNGLLYRESVQGDARLKRIVLTEKARKINEIHGQRISEIEALITEGVTQQGLEQFLLVAGKISHNIQKYLDE